jgi:hypothetical protein
MKMKQMKYLQASKLVSAAATAVAVAVVGLTACSTVPKAADDNGEKPKAATEKETTKVESAIVSNCRLSTVGLPCDPDGNGAASECEGVCWIDDGAFVSCLPVAQVNLTVTDLNGRICGDVEGRDCSQSCENGECVDKNARLGTACRPNNNSSTCEGVCTLTGGEPACDEVTVCSNVGISDDGCSLTACNFETFEPACKVFELENSVCEASQIPVIEAGVSSAPTEAAVANDAGDAAPDANQTSSDVVDAAADRTSAPSEPTETVTSAAPADAAVSRIDGGRGALDAGDAGPVYVAPSSATKVVGGACSTAPGRTGTSGMALVLAALGLVTLRRRAAGVRAAK